MPVDRNAPLPKEVHEIVMRRIGELTEELKTKFDLGFCPGVYILYTADGDGRTDGFWVLFSPTTPVELAYGFMEAGHETMRKFINSGIIERLKILRQSTLNPPKSLDSK
jgi:hypothetical protein